MSTKLSDSATVPLWGFIVIIAVGSIVILASVFMALQYYINHHDANIDDIRNDPETVRKVTVRRGRIVPQSHYLSLTGSRFGVGAFSEDSRSNTRSKSPFEWWSNLPARSVSQMSWMSRTNDSAAKGYQTPEPTFAGDTPDKQKLRTLSIAASFEAMSEKPPAYPFLSKPLSAHCSSRTINFSRIGLGIRSPSVAPFLPQIVEASSRQPVISSRRSRHSVFPDTAPPVAVNQLGAPRSPASITDLGPGANPCAQMSSKPSEDIPFEHNPVGEGERAQSELPQLTQSQNNLPRSRSLSPWPRPAEIAFNATAMSEELSVTPISRRTSSQPDLGPYLAQSPQKSTSTLSSRRSPLCYEPDDTNHVTGRLSSELVQALPQVSPTIHDYRAYSHPRQDLQPVRWKSQKGKVLRKKSLQRAERDAKG